MYVGVRKLVNWIKSNFKVTEEEIDRVLSTDYFKEIDERLGEYDDPFEYFFNEQSIDEKGDGFEKSSKDVDENGREVTILDMAKVFLNELGIENYSTNFLKYSLKLEIGNECDIFENIRMYLRLTWKLDKYAIGDVISYISIHGKKDRMRPCGKYLNDSMLEHLEDLIKANDVMYEEPENLPSCEDVLQDKVNKAIKLLKYGYSLSEEQISLLASYNYNISSELSNNIAGDHNGFYKKIRISPRALEPMETILHEMMHALGIKKEGLTELLAEKIYMKYKPLIASINSFEEEPLIVKSYEVTLYDYLSPNSYNNWSYFDISDRYRQLFRVLRDVNMENEIIDSVLNGVDIENALKINFGELNSINEFMESTENLQKATYDKFYGTKTRHTTEEKERCDRALFEFGVEGPKNLKLSSIRKIVQSLNEDSTFGEFLRVRDDIFKSVFGSKSEVAKAFFNRKFKGHFEREEFRYIMKQFDLFEGSIDIISSKFKIPNKILSNFLFQDMNLLKNKKFVVIDRKDMLLVVSGERDRCVKNINYLSRVKADDGEIGFLLEERQVMKAPSTKDYSPVAKVSSDSFEFVEEDEQCDAIKIGNMAIATDMLTEEDFAGKTFDFDTPLKDIPTIIKTKNRNKGVDR